MEYRNHPDGQKKTTDREERKMIKLVDKGPKNNCRETYCFSTVSSTECLLAQKQCQLICGQVTCGYVFCGQVNRGHVICGQLFQTYLCIAENLPINYKF